MGKEQTALEIRSIPRLWPGSTIVILGGGPSTSNVDLNRVFDGRFRVIGVNQAFRLGPVDLLWFVDYPFFKLFEQDIAQFAGLKACCATQLPEMPWPYHIKRVRRSPKTYGIESSRADMVSWNTNAGAAAINVAYHLGAKRVLLIGFDMRRVKGKSHYHDLYEKRDKTRDPFKRHLKCFDAIASDADRLGVEIINCTPGSAITQFPVIPFEEVE